jgi:hypothetical protein
MHAKRRFCTPYFQIHLGSFASALLFRLALFFFGVCAQGLTLHEQRPCKGLRCDGPYQSSRRMSPSSVGEMGGDNGGVLALVLHSCGLEATKGSLRSSPCYCFPSLLLSLLAYPSCVCGGGFFLLFLFSPTSIGNLVCDSVCALAVVERKCASSVAGVTLLSDFLFTSKRRLSFSLSLPFLSPPCHPANEPAPP